MRRQLATWAFLAIPMCAPIACGTSSEPKTPPVAQKQAPKKAKTSKAPIKTTRSDEDQKMTPASRLLDDTDQADKKSTSPTPLDDQNWGSVPWGNGAWGENTTTGAGAGAGAGAGPDAGAAATTNGTERTEGPTPEK